MLTPETAVVVSILLCLVGAGATCLLGRWRRAAGWTAFAFTLVTAGLIFSAVGRLLWVGAGEPTTYLSVPALGFALRVHVDGLSAWFLMLAALIAVPAMLFSIEYLDPYAGQGVGRYYGSFLVFLAAMYGLVSTTDMMWFFFIFWQMMTWPGYALIRFESDKPANVRAANQYLRMMQIACGLTMIGAWLLALGPAQPGDGLTFDFATISAALPAMLRERPVLVGVAFALFLLGFGIKLGMWPFGAMWLPDAHPAAPSPVSAMLSGVMIKTGVYGLMRYFLWLVPLEAQSLYPMAAWGAVVAGLGTITLLTGTLQALRQEQTKRLLAFHSIGQVGYILLGVGTCLALLPSSDWAVLAVAALGFCGALFHTLNHGVFKALLFLNAGALLRATGTQDLNKLGGLMRLMPVTAATALVAAAAISGVPLFNGFASKWSLYVASFQGAPLAQYLPLCGLIAVFTSVLTLASFVKFFGAAFLTRTSPLAAERAAGKSQLRFEGGWLMRLPQISLAAVCVGLGVMPGLAFAAMRGLLQHSRGGLGSLLADAAPVSTPIRFGLTGLEGRASFMPGVLLVALLLLAALAWWLGRGRGGGRRSVTPWQCGYAEADDQSRYAAHGYYHDFKQAVPGFGGHASGRSGSGPGPREEPTPPATWPPDA